MFAWIKEDIIGVIFLIALAGLLYIYKTRGFAKSGKYAKPSNIFFLVSDNIVRTVICLATLERIRNE